jgi:hypothetical protein
VPEEEPDFTDEGAGESEAEGEEGEEEDEEESVPSRVTP